MINPLRNSQAPTGPPRRQKPADDAKQQQLSLTPAQRRSKRSTDLLASEGLGTAPASLARALMRTSASLPMLHKPPQPLPTPHARESGGRIHAASKFPASRFPFYVGGGPLGSSFT